MTADIKLLPLPLTLRHPSDKDLADHVQAYARAVAEHNVAARDAEVEELRAALEALKAHQGNAIVNQSGVIRALSEVRDEQGAEIHRLRAAKGQAEARAERLAEALRFYADTNNWIGRFVTDPTTPAEEDGGDNAREALRDHDQEGKDG